MAENNKFEHSTTSYGENLYKAITSSTSYSTGQASNLWYDEEKLYDYDNADPSPSNFLDVGHFTQMIWKKSERVCFACARAVQDNRNIYIVVANYDPAGNVQGQFTENVPRPQ